MRSVAVALLVGLCGCNQILGVDDPPARCAGGCACHNDMECGTNELCDYRDTSSACECAAGFQRTAAGCEWKGIVVDPGFEQASTWNAMEDAVLDITAATQGMKDFGAARLDAASCGAMFTQQVVMPRYSFNVRPLVAEITYLMTGSVAPMFGIGTAWSTVPDAGSAGWNTARVCLGSGQYASMKSNGPGEITTLAIGRTVDSSCLAGGPSVDIDHFELMPANLGECPPPDEVLNGEAENPGGWTFTPSTPSAALSAGFVNGLGQNGSRGVQLSAANSCGPGKAMVPLAPGVADTIGSPALSFYVSAMLSAVTGPINLTATLDRSRIAIPATQQMTILHICVPAPLRGSSALFGLGMSSSDCTVKGTATVDTVRLGSDPACGTDFAIADPSFESGYPLLDTSTPDVTATVQSVIPLNSAAHHGARVLALATGSCTADASVRMHVLTPTPDANAGPVLTFWYRSTNEANSILTVSNYQDVKTPIPALAWRQATMCLDPKLAGRGQDVSFSLRPGNCAVPGSLPATVQLDDLSVNTDVRCPAM